MKQKGEEEYDDSKKEVVTIPSKNTSQNNSHYGLLESSTAKLDHQWNLFLSKFLGLTMEEVSCPESQDQVQKSLLSKLEEQDDLLLQVVLAEGYLLLAENLLRLYPSLLETKNKNVKTVIDIIVDQADLISLKLCLEFRPKNSALNEKNAPIVIDSVLGSSPYITNISLSIYNSVDENSDKLAIIIVCPDMQFSQPIKPTENLYYKYFQNCNIPTLLIGDKIRSLSFDLIKKGVTPLIKDKSKKILIVVDYHGSLDKEGKLIIDFDNTYCNKTPEDLFKIISEIFKDKVEIMLNACYGFPALKDVNILPTSSKLIVFSKYAPVCEDDLKAMLDKEIDFSKYPELFSVEYFLQSYCMNMTTVNNVPGIGISGSKSLILDELPWPKTEISEQLKSYIISKLSAQNHNLKNKIENAINRIIERDSLEELKAPTDIYEKVFVQYKKPTTHEFSNTLNLPLQLQLLSKLLDDTNNCVAKVEKQHYLETNYALQFNQNQYCSSELDAVCKNLPIPEEPIFGPALIILYELYSSNHTNCVVDSIGVINNEYN